MLTSEELQSTFPPDKVKICVDKLTTAFKNNQLLNWDTGILEQPRIYNGFTLTSIPYIDIDKVSLFLGLNLKSTDYRDMLQYSIRDTYLNTVMQFILKDVIIADESLRDIIRSTTAYTNSNGVFVCIFGDPENNLIKKYKIDDICPELKDNTSSITSPDDKLKSLIYERINIREFVNCNTYTIGTTVNNDIKSFTISFHITPDMLDVMCGIIERFFDMQVSKPLTTNELVALSYQHHILESIVCQACSNATILAFKFGTKLFSLSDLKYKVVQ